MSGYVNVEEDYHEEVSPGAEGNSAWLRR